jgi:hypothetical protein
MWFKWFMVVYLMLSILGNAATVDKPRTPISHGAATFNILCYGLMMLACSIIGTNMIWKLLNIIADWVNENRRLRARVQFLLEANNREVIRRRAAEEFANRGTVEIPKRPYLQ